MGCRVRASAGVRFERCAQFRPVRAIGLVQSGPTRIAPWRLAGSMRTPTIPTSLGDTSSRGSRKRPEAQGRTSAAAAVRRAERRIAQAGGTMAAVHPENDHWFYEQRGYRLTDENGSGGRHGWLVKDLSRRPHEGPPRCWARANLQRAGNQINRHDVAGVSDNRAQVKHLVKLEPAGDGIRLA